MLVNGLPHRPNSILPDQSYKSRDGVRGLNLDSVRACDGQDLAIA